MKTGMASGEADPTVTQKNGNAGPRTGGRRGEVAAQAAQEVRVHDSLATIDTAAWDALLDASPAPTPFMRHAYLHALDASGSARSSTGWKPLFLTVEAAPDHFCNDGDIAAPTRYLAACPLYLKSHSYGEYVFDWAWADAYQRAGHDYYPKLLCAVPFTPVPGSRLLAQTDAARTTLLVAIKQLLRQHRLSSAHGLFLSDADRACAEQAGWLMRSTVQFHWQNRDVEPDGSAAPALPYADFDDFLASLQRDKRKKIQQERRQVREAGVTFRALRGAEISSDDWDFFYRCYVQTYDEHHSTPYLTRDFFARMAATMPEHWLLFVAERAGVQVAASLIALDPQRQVAYGRYWGAVEPIRCLHFDACYYQPLAWCIAQGWRRFEGGAQGEHKMARGLMPVQTWSAHQLSHPAFNDAVASYLAREGAGIEAYVDELRAHSPFRMSGTPGTQPPVDLA